MGVVLYADLRRSRRNKKGAQCKTVNMSSYSVSLDDPKLLKAREILIYCGVNNDQLQPKLEKCRKEISRLRQSDSTCLINDAIHGPIEMSAVIYKIMNTPEFHRLKDIKQLGGANYVYPGANHTRFDHSIGEFSLHLQRQLRLDFPTRPDLFSDGEVICVEIAGLCHDLGHGPLSHMFEHYVMKTKHEDLSVSIFRRLMTENINVLAEFVNLKEGLGIDEFKLIELMIRPPERRQKLPESWTHREFLCEIVSNKLSGVDVDKWDYYARDCHYLGVTTDFQARRCMLLARIVKTDNGEFHIAFRDKELDNIYGMFRTRGILHQKAYQHKTIKAVERMISDAIIQVQDVPFIQVLGSDRAVSVKTACKEAEEGHIKSYLALTDSILGVIKCCPTSITKSPTEKEALLKAKDLLRRIEERDLYHCSWKVRIPKKNTELDHEITSGRKEHGDSLWQALMSMSRQPQGESIHIFLQPNKQKTIRTLDLWVPIEKIKLPSENRDNPVEEVLFYRKPKGGSSPIETLTREEVREMTSSLVVPRAFIECEVRVYDKRKSVYRAIDDQDALRDALIKWKKNAELKHNGSH